MDVIKPAIDRWREADGDNTFALNWKLDENSHVWEIGGYEGRWVQQIWDKFQCNIHVFEPQPWAVEKLRTRFYTNDKIDINPFGLWVEDGNFNIGSYETDGASLLSAKPPHKLCEFFKIDKVLTKPVDLCLMNIEGAEYTILPYLIEGGLIQNFDQFWCQFHPNKPDDVDYDFMNIAEGMAKTHAMIWNFYPVAVAWRKR